MVNGSGQERVMSIEKLALVVDDDATLRLVARKHLTKLGFIVHEATTGLEALDKCRGINFDLILMDIQMPDMDGLEATQRIREMEAVSGAPTAVIIAVTASQDRERAVDIGMNDFLFKPFVFSTFKSVVESHFPTVAEEAEKNPAG